MVRFCTSFGSPLQQGMKFCTKCGSAINSAPAFSVDPSKSGALRVADSLVGGSGHDGQQLPAQASTRTEAEEEVHDQGNTMDV